MIGARSIVLNLKIENKNNTASPYEVKIQANKNFGICDVILPNTPVPPEKTYINLKKEDRKREKALYDIRKETYDKEMLKRKFIRNVIFDKFQGRQFNSDVVVERLKETLCDLLNSKEL